MTVKVGIIGGSGLDNPDFLSNARDTYSGTQWGEPSAPIREGDIEGVPVALLARHGRNHTLSPSAVNYRANVQALRNAGCTHILATTAVGSLREEIGRGDLVIIDQFIDFTRQRKMTYHEYFSPHAAVHTPMADPYDQQLREVFIRACSERGYAFHPAGTVITIEGPRFSTRAESRMFRSWGADIINMSIATETILANELGIPYAAIGMSPEYDCWKCDEHPVSWEEICRVFQNNAEKVTTILRDSIPLIAAAVGR